MIFAIVGVNKIPTRRANFFSTTVIDLRRGSALRGGH